MAFAPAVSKGGFRNPARPSILSLGLVGEEAQAAGCGVRATVNHVTSDPRLALLSRRPGSPSARGSPLGS